MINEEMRECIDTAIEGGATRWMLTKPQVFFGLKRELAEAKAEISAMRRWVNNNMTFYDVEPDGPNVCTSGPNIPTLAAVSKRIWYHATDNQTVSLFSEVIDLRQWEGK
jgi:hypothetical protein